MEVWYDRSLRLWCAYLTDESGSQAGDTQYGTSKAEVIRYAKAMGPWS